MLHFCQPLAAAMMASKRFVPVSQAGNGVGKRMLRLGTMPRCASGGEHARWLVTLSLLTRIFAESGLNFLTAGLPPLDAPCVLSCMAPPPVDQKAKEMDVVHPGVPEDIAIWGAKLLGQLRAASTRTETHLCPADVVCMAQRFSIIAAEFTAYLNAPSPEQEWRLLSSFDPQQVGPGCASDHRSAGSAGVFADLQAQVQFMSDVENFQRHCTRMYESFHEDARQANTPVGWSIRGRGFKQRPYLLEVDSLSELNEGHPQKLL